LPCSTPSGLRRTLPVHSRASAGVALRAAEAL